MDNITVRTYRGVGNPPAGHKTKMQWLKRLFGKSKLSLPVGATTTITAVWYWKGRQLGEDELANQAFLHVIDVLESRFGDIYYPKVEVIPLRGHNHVILNLDVDCSQNNAATMQAFLKEQFTSQNPQIL